MSESKLHEQKVIEDYSTYMQRCREDFGKPEDECEKLWRTYASQIGSLRLMGSDSVGVTDAKGRVSQFTRGVGESDQDLAKAARNYPNTKRGYEDFLSEGCGYENVEDCKQAWNQVYGTGFDAKPFVGVAHDQKNWKKI